MKLRGRSPRVGLAILAALLAALVVSACGGSSSSGGSGGSSKSASSKNASATTTNSSTSATGSAARSAFTTCLKQHGVTAGSGFRGGFGGRRNGTGTGTIPKITANGTTTTGGSAGPGGGFPGGGSGAPNGAPGGGLPGGGAGFAGGNSKFAKAFQACRSKLGSSGFGAGRFRGGPGTGNARPRFSTTALKSYVSCIRKNGYAAMPEPKASTSGSFFPASVEKNAKFQAANKKCESILLKAFRRPAAGAGSGGGTYTITGSSTTSST
jgi:hypothetical protein